MQRSWKTTVLGVVTIISAVAGAVKFLVDGDPATNPDFFAVWTAILAGVGLIFAKDSGVTGGTVPATPEAQARVFGPVS